MSTAPFYASFGISRESFGAPRIEFALRIFSISPITSRFQLVARTACPERERLRFQLNAMAHDVAGGGEKDQLKAAALRNTP